MNTHNRFFNCARPCVLVFIFIVFLAQQWGGAGIFQSSLLGNIFPIYEKLNFLKTILNKSYYFFSRTFEFNTFNNFFVILNSVY